MGGTGVRHRTHPLDPTEAEPLFDETTGTECCLQLALCINPSKPSVITWLHFECSAPYMHNLPFLISDIRSLWRSALGTRVPECQKLKM